MFLVVFMLTTIHRLFFIEYLDMQEEVHLDEAIALELVEDPTEFEDVLVIEGSSAGIGGGSV